MGTFDTVAIIGSHAAFGWFVWLVTKTRCKAVERGKQLSRAELRRWVDELDEGRYDLDHPGWGDLAAATGFKAPPDASGLEPDMVLRENERAALSFDEIVIDLTERKGGAS